METKIILRQTFTRFFVITNYRRMNEKWNSEISIKLSNNELTELILLCNCSEKSNFLGQN